MKKIFVSLLVTFLIVSAFASVALAKPKEPVDSITFIHYKDGKIKPIDQNGKAPTCYKLMGVRWKEFPIEYVIGQGVDANAVLAATNEWDSHTSTTLFGSHSQDNSANFYDSPDGRNEYSFGDYSQSGVIAVTRTWYTRYSKAIVEYDVMFDSSWTWGNDDPNKMDWQNIATHETGHGIGLADLYSSACADQTMYGYSDFGETIKRDLAAGDIAGLQKLYGV